MKKVAPKCSALVPHNVPGIPWLKAHVDLIGPWELNSNGLKIKIHVMIIINPVTNLVEFARVTSTKSAENA